MHSPDVSLQDALSVQTVELGGSEPARLLWSSSWGPRNQPSPDNGIFIAGYFNLNHRVSLLHKLQSSFIRGIHGYTRRCLHLINMPDNVDGQHADIHPTYDEETISKTSKNDTDNQYDIGIEEKNGTGEVDDLPDLQRRLKSRHLAMIAIGK